MTIALLYIEDCPSRDALLPRLRELLRRCGVRDQVELRCVQDDTAARRERFLGSPTVRVGGRDVEPGADERRDFGVKCRLYATPAGLRGTPPDEWILDALLDGPA